MNNKREIVANNNPNTKKLLNDSFFRIPANDEEKNTKENMDTIVLIDNYTRLYENKIKRFLLSNILDKYQNLSFNDIKYNQDTKMYEIHLKNKDIVTFDILSNYIEDKELIKELNSKERYHKCHNKSIALSNNIKDSYILTGYYSPTQNKVLHSVVEKIENGKSYILDWTQNIKMSKEDYIKLYKFKILQKISCKDLIKDQEILNKAEYQCLKTYLVFRDEIMRDFERNKHLFEESLSPKKR